MAPAIHIVFNAYRKHERQKNQIAALLCQFPLTSSWQRREPGLAARPAAATTSGLQPNFLIVVSDVLVPFDLLCVPTPHASRTCL